MAFLWFPIYPPRDGHAFPSRRMTISNSNFVSSPIPKVRSWLVNGQFMNRHYQTRKHVASDLKIEEVTQSVHDYNKASVKMRAFGYQKSGEYYQMFGLHHRSRCLLQRTRS